MRIQIVGTSGSGKSTFANKLAELTGYARLEIDNLQFNANWVKRTDKDFDADLSKAIESENWVACGNYFSSAARIYKKADYIVWLKYPLWKILWRVTGRTLRRIWTKERVCNGNIETFWQQFFTSKSIFVWVFTSHKKHIIKYGQMSQDPAQSHKWIVVTTEMEAETCLKMLEEKINKT